MLSFKVFLVFWRIEEIGAYLGGGCFIRIMVTDESHWRAPYAHVALAQHAPHKQVVECNIYKLISIQR